MRKFDTKVQYLKYKVLREVAKHAWEGDLLESITDIPKELVPGPKPSMRCCIYKERAVLTERIKMAMGGNKDNHNVIEVIDIACDECPSAGYTVTDSCRGCLAHRCEDVCKFDALTFDENHVAHIDKSKCKNCGACAKVCPFGAIIDKVRPCRNACKADAISFGEYGEAKIDDDKCTACGACVYKCPWGAIVDKSYILDVIEMLKGGRQDIGFGAEENPDNNKLPRVYAVIAPAISSQFVYAHLGQIVTGLKKLGFYKVVEAALGADMVAATESKELAEKGEVMSSCCPAFVSYVKKAFPDLAPYVSSSLSPMAAVAKYIKELHPTSKVVFIGPCTAKKMEMQLPNVAPYVDSVITFEELQALFDSRDIDITTLEERPLYDASAFGRGFAKCGGLSEAVAEGLKEQGFTDFDLRPVTCNGLEECKVALLKATRNLNGANFIEGMACVGGCVGGAGCLTHSEKNKAFVATFSDAAKEDSIIESVQDAEERI